VPSSAIGELAMDALKGLDPVAYVRFASVYRDFRGAADFQAVLAEIAGRAAVGQDGPNGERIHPPK
jgi:transcriptional repressor NrdR